LRGVSLVIQTQASYWWRTPTPEEVFYTSSVAGSLYRNPKIILALDKSNQMSLFNTQDEGAIVKLNIQIVRN